MTRRLLLFAAAAALLVIIGLLVHIELRLDRLERAPTADGRDGTVATTDPGSAVEQADPHETPPPDAAARTHEPEPLPTHDVVDVLGDVDFEGFSPETVTIARTEAVRWRLLTPGMNVVSGKDGVADHGFCSPSDQGCDEAPALPAGSTYVRQFDAPGVFPYFCSSCRDPHVRGFVIVE